MAEPQVRLSAEEAVIAPRKRGQADRLTPFWVVMSATMVKNSLILRRYMPNLVGYLVEVSVRVFFFFLFSRFMTLRGPSDLAGKQLFVFFLCGILLLLFNSTAIKTPLGVVTDDMMNGTLEYLYTNPISRYPYYMGAVAVGAMLDMLFFTPMFIFTVWYAGVSFSGALFILLACFAVLVTLMALGTLIALLGLLWRQVASIMGVMGLIFEFLAGAYLRVSEFPPVLRYAAYALPHTWGYDLARYYSMGPGWKTVEPLWFEWTILTGQAVLFTFVALFLLNRVEQRAKRRGLHLI